MNQPLRSQPAPQSVPLEPLKSARPAPVQPDTSGLAQLIQTEGDLRQCATHKDLWRHLANETAALLPFGMSLALQRDTLGVDAKPRWRVASVSGVAEVQRDAPMIRWYGRLVDEVWAQTQSGKEALAFELPKYADPEDPCTQESGLRHLLWVPLFDTDEQLAGGWLLARDSRWEEGHQVLARRLAQAYAHGASAITGRAKPKRPWKRKVGRFALAGAAVAALLGFVPVSLTTLAPAEVASQKPFVVSAPVVGVVERMMVTPGAQVKEGDPLVQLVDTSLRSDFDVAERRLEVARSKTLRLQQASIDDSTAKRELAVAQSEQSVAEVERDYAKAMLAKAVVRAERSGVVLYGNASDWVGRPVAVGEAIMRVADPKLVEFKIEVPVADAVNLHKGAEVRIYLDASPLRAIQATIVRAAYKAESDAAGIASFMVTARAAADVMPRLGLRGTARIYGENVSLAYYLFRRPIVALRRWTGI